MYAVVGQEIYHTCCFEKVDSQLPSCLMMLLRQLLTTKNGCELTQKCIHYKPYLRRYHSSMKQECIRMTFLENQCLQLLFKTALSRVTSNTGHKNLWIVYMQKMARNNFQRSLLLVYTSNNRNQIIYPNSSTYRLIVTDR